jgi:hypothetical protein
MSASVKQQARTAARTAKRLATIERKHQQRAAAAQLQEQRDDRTKSIRC